MKVKEREFVGNVLPVSDLLTSEALVSSPVQFNSAGSLSIRDASLRGKITQTVGGQWLCPDAPVYCRPAGTLTSLVSNDTINLIYVDYEGNRAECHQNGFHGGGAWTGWNYTLKPKIATGAIALDDVPDGFSRLVIDTTTNPATNRLYFRNGNSLTSLLFQ